MDLPSLSALKALEALFRLGSVTLAARDLHLSPSAVSHRLAALEAELGIALLVRAGRGVRVTPRGAQLAEATGEALALLEGTLRALAPPQGEARKALSISCSPSFAIRFLVPRLSALRSAHPELDLRVAADDVLVEPARAAVDACVRLAAGPLPRHTCEKLIDEVAFPVLSPRLLERGAPLRRPADLASYPLLHEEALAHEPRRVSWAAWFSAVGERRIDAARGVRFSHAYLAIEAALAGDGVALARRTLVAEDLVRGRLVAPLDQSVASGLSYWLITSSRNVELSSPLVGLRSFLVRALRDAAKAADGVGAGRGARDKIVEPAARAPGDGARKRKPRGRE
jgi:LysR family glycine cleavage system transcriptional activator